MIPGEWYKSTFYPQSHRLSSDGVDAVCWLPLVIPPEQQPDGWRVVAKDIKSDKCGTCKKQPLDFLRSAQPTLRRSADHELGAWLARLSAGNPRTAPIDARELAEWRQFEAICERVRRELGGEYVV